MSFQELSGDFWMEAESNVDAIVCTINTVCKTNGGLVMGAGIAQQFADQFEWLQERWGCRTAKQGNRTYPFVELMSGTHPAIVGIHTKYDWKDHSPFKLVDRSVKQLYIIATSLGWKRILMTKPGCGYGGLHWEKQVRPLLEQVLDERFVVISD